MSFTNVGTTSQKPFSLNSRTESILFSLVSLPVVWLLLQSHHMILCEPLAERLIATVPLFAKDLSSSSPAFTFAMINLSIFGALALIFPNQGFGHSWKPERRQSLAVLFFIGLALLYPSLDILMQPNAVEPFKSMGFVTWTITPVEEEILFRGFLYTLLLKIFRCSPESSWRKVLPVLLLGSAWFALWHLYPSAIIDHGWKLVLSQTFFTFWGGLFFSVMRHWTGSIWLVIPLHAAGNFMVNLM